MNHSNESKGDLQFLIPPEAKQPDQIPITLVLEIGFGLMNKSGLVARHKHCWHWVVFPPENPISRHVL